MINIISLLTTASHKLTLYEFQTILFNVNINHSLHIYLRLIFDKILKYPDKGKAGLSYISNEMINDKLN